MGKPRKFPAELSIAVLGKDGALLQLGAGAAEIKLAGAEIQVHVLDALARAFATSHWERIEREALAAGSDRQAFAEARVHEGRGPRWAVMISIRLETLAEAGHRRLSEAPPAALPWRCDLPGGAA